MTQSALLGTAPITDSGGRAGALGPDYLWLTDTASSCMMNSSIVSPSASYQHQFEYIQPPFPISGLGITL